MSTFAVPGAREACTVCADRRCGTVAVLRAAAMPALTQPVNDFAASSTHRRCGHDGSRHSRAPGQDGRHRDRRDDSDYEPEADIRDYAVKLFENGGRGIGDKGKNNGILVLLALKERRVWIEVGYDLEEIVTDGYAGETSRQFMVPLFKQGDYGGGLEAGVMRLIGRIAEVRQVTLDGVPRPEAPSRAASPRPRRAGPATIRIVRRRRYAARRRPRPRP